MKLGLTGHDGAEEPPQESRDGVGEEETHPPESTGFSIVVTPFPPPSFPLLLPSFSSSSGLLLQACWVPRTPAGLKGRRWLHYDAEHPSEPFGETLDKMTFVQMTVSSTNNRSQQSVAGGELPFAHCRPQMALPGLL